MKKDLYDKSVRTAHFVLCGRPGYMRDGEDGFESEDHVFTVRERSLDNDEPTERDLQEFIDEVEPDEEDMASFLADCECWDYGDEWATLEVNCELRFEDAQDVALAYLFGGKRPGVIELGKVEKYSIPYAWTDAVVQNFVYYARQDNGTEVPCSEDGREEK